MDRIFVTIDGEETEIFPTDYRHAKFITEREEGWIFFRTRYQGTLVLTGDLFEAFIALGEDCSKQLVRIEREGLDDWNGYFSITDGEVNLDDCTFIFTPRINDGYDAFLDQGSQPYNIMEQTRRTVSTLDPAVDYTNCRMMLSVIQGMINVIDPSYTYLSTFFSNATNPVTAITNKYRYLAIAQLSDVKRPDASEQVRYAYLSFLDMMAILRDMFNVWWSIKNKNIVLEHYIHYHQDDLEDLTGDRGDIRAQRYIFDMSKMWKYERWEGLNRGAIELGIDFVNQGFAYDGTCLLPKDNEKRRAVQVATDVEGVNNVDYVDNFPDDGFFLFVGSSSTGGTCQSAIGFVSGMNKINGDLSWANLLNYFWLDGRVLTRGTFFTNPIDFVSAEPNKLQTVIVALCAGYNPYGKFRTELAETLGIDGRMVRAETATNGGTTRLTIAFGYEENERPTYDEPSKSITIFQSDLKPNTLDASFSELSGSGLELTVDWEIYQGINLIDSDTETWVVAENVLSDSFDPDFPAYDPSYCYNLTITPNGGGWAIIINQAPILKC
jgi:acyl-CoA-binding protein